MFFTLFCELAIMRSLQPMSETRKSTLFGPYPTAQIATECYRVIPPFLKRPESRNYAAKASFCFGVMPPMAMLGHS
jgi:hypothetical protein